MENKDLKFLYEKAKETMRLLLIDKKCHPLDIIVFCDIMLSETATMLKVADKIIGGDKYNIFIDFVAKLPDLVKEFVNKTEDEATSDVAKSAIEKLMNLKKEEK